MRARIEHNGGRKRADNTQVGLKLLIEYSSDDIEFSKGNESEHG
jgi:hypothetical protein